MKRLALRLLAVLGVLLAVAHSVVWFAIERQLRVGLTADLAAWRAQGIDIAAGPPAAAGWPLRATLVLPDVVVGPGGVPGGATLRTDRVAAGLAFVAPDTLRVDLPAALLLRLPGAPDLRFDSPDAHVTITLDDPDHGNFDATDLRAGWQAGGAARQATAALAHVQARRTPQGWVGGLSAQSIELPAPPPGQTLPLGRRLASVSLDAALTGRFGPPTLAPAAAAAFWRDSGGHLSVSRLALGYGPLGLSGDGDLRLDAALQPVVAADLRLIGWSAALDALTESAALPARSAAAVKAVLGLLARPAENGAAPEARVPLAMRDGTVSIAGFPLARVPKLAWPAPQ